MKFLFIFLCVFSWEFAFAQTQLEIEKWTFSECNSSLSPYKLKERIVSYSIEGNKTFFTVAFPENCCIQAGTSLYQLKDTLYIEVKDTLDKRCWCDCCYSIDYVLNKKAKARHFYFNGRRIYLSKEPYKTYPIEYELRGKDTINYVDKYGDRQGLWIWPEEYKNTSYDTAVVYFENGSEKYYYLSDNNKRRKAIKNKVCSYAIVDGDTLNYVDSNNLEQGIHVDNYDILNHIPLRKMIFYKDGKEIHGFYKDYYKGVILSETIILNGDCFMISKFNSDGKKKSECKCDYTIFEMDGRQEKSLHEYDCIELKE